LVEHDSPYKPVLTAEITKRFAQVHIQPPMYSPVHGAVMMALARGQQERGV
jgi:hypothetical protein